MSNNIKSTTATNIHLRHPDDDGSRGVIQSPQYGHFCVSSMTALPQCGQIISPGSSPSAKTSSSDGYSWSPSGLLECGIYLTSFRMSLNRGWSQRSTHSKINASVVETSAPACCIRAKARSVSEARRDPTASAATNGT